jgi:hypothetical protein
MSYSKPFISINRVASLMGIHHDTAKSYLESLNFERIRIGRRDLYRSAVVLEHLQTLFGR